MEYLIGVVFSGLLALFYILFSKKKIDNKKEIKDAIQNLNELYKELDTVKEKDLSPEEVMEYWKNVKKD